MTADDTISIIDVVDERGFARIPPCADPGFDHRTCDYWEDADRGSKASRLDWLTPTPAPTPASGEPSGPATTVNPFLDDLAEAREAAALGGMANPFLTGDDAFTDNPFAPRPEARPGVLPGAPRKLQLLGRGLGVAGSYAKVLLRGDEPLAYAQFGPLTAYPRAQRTRELYPALPDAPLPAVITCIATTPAARGEGLAHRLIEAVCDDLAQRGFAAVEAYPEVGARPDATSAAAPAFWLSVGFTVAATDDRFPVLRRELA